MIYSPSGGTLEGVSDATNLTEEEFLQLLDKARTAVASGHDPVGGFELAIDREQRLMTKAKTAGRGR